MEGWELKRRRERGGEGRAGQPLRGVKSQGWESGVKRKSLLWTESQLSFSSNGAAICQSGREGRGQQVSLAPDAATAVPQGPKPSRNTTQGPNEVVGLFTLCLCGSTPNDTDEHREFNQVSLTWRCPTPLITQPVLHIGWLCSITHVQSPGVQVDAFKGLVLAQHFSIWTIG